MQGPGFTTTGGGAAAGVSGEGGGTAVPDLRATLHWDSVLQLFTVPIWAGGGDAEVAQALAAAGTSSSLLATSEAIPIACAVDSASHRTVIAGDSCNLCAGEGRYALQAAPVQGESLRAYYVSQVSNLVEVLDAVQLGPLHLPLAKLYVMDSVHTASGRRTGASVLGLSASREEGGKYASPWLAALAALSQPVGWCISVPRTTTPWRADFALGETARGACAGDVRLPLLASLPDPPSSSVSRPGMYYIIEISGWDVILRNGDSHPLSTQHPTHMIVDTGSTATALPGASAAVIPALYHAEVAFLRFHTPGGAVLPVDMAVQHFSGEGHPAIVPMAEAKQYSRGRRVGVLGIVAMRGARLGFFPEEGVCTFASDTTTN